MDIHIQLYSNLREKLPQGSKGKAVLHLKDEASLQDLLDELEITQKIVISVNNEQETDTSRRLQNGDNVKMFSSISGG
ncbi:MAG: MoaD/ThiS family protein [Chloroflexota bacterium]